MTNTLAIVAAVAISMNLSAEAKAGTGPVDSESARKLGILAAREHRVVSGTEPVTCAHSVTAGRDRHWINAAVQAIWTAEGGTNASVPYGILSVPVRNREEARQVCERTVVNNLRRWQAAGRPGCFYNWLGDRYAPAAADKRGNVNWKRNVRALLKHQTCNCKCTRHPRR